MEAKVQAPIKLIKSLENEIQKLNRQWNGLGVRIDVALKDVDGYIKVNRDLMKASDRNTELRHRYTILAGRFINYKCQMENTIDSMR